MRNAYLTLLRAGAVAAALALAAVALGQTQVSQPAITLLNTNAAEDAAAPALPIEAVYRQNYRAFAETRVGESSAAEVFTLAFHQADQITGISATGDFQIAGGTCNPGHTYQPGNRCTVEMVFAPQGPGRRSGRLEVRHSASEQPFLVPGGGLGTGPVVSFVPSIVTTVPGTYTSGTGLLLNPQGLAVDGGDNLYLVDTGNNLIRYRDSSGVITTLVGGGTNASQTYNGPPLGVQLSSPYGITVPEYGTAYISDTGSSVVRGLAPWSFVTTEVGGGSSAGGCYINSPCLAANFEIFPPLGIAHDSHQNIFFNIFWAPTFPSGVIGAFPFWLQIFPKYVAAQLSLTGWTESSTSYPIAVDDNDTIYTAIEIPANYSGTYITNGPNPYCGILAQNNYFSWGDQAGADVWIVAGTHTCGFSGDGGPATGAEISTSVQGLALDAAGNLYFTDTGNNRVRRIDAATGIIRTIAGYGSTGYWGDGGPATSAPIHSPTGIAVDSKGDVYVTGLVGSAGNAVVRQIGARGMLAFAAQRPATTSAAQTVVVTNSGNAGLNVAQTVFTSGNTGDFAIDPVTTTCNFKSALAPGRSCQIGFLFAPTATGARSAVVTLYDDTVTGANQVQLNGTGAVESVSPTSLTFASTTVGSSTAAQNVTVTNPLGTPLGISGIGFTGTNPADYSQTSTCGSALAPGKTCAVSVTFAPQAVGPSSATLTITTGNGPCTVALSGTGAASSVRVSLPRRSMPPPADNPSH